MHVILFMLVSHALPLFICASIRAEVTGDNSGNLSGNEDVVSLSDIIPETNICFVSLSILLENTYTNTLKALINAFVISYFKCTLYLNFFCLFIVIVFSL